MLSHRLWLVALIAAAVSGLPLKSDDTSSVLSGIAYDAQDVLRLTRRSADPEEPAMGFAPKEDPATQFDRARHEAQKKQDQYTAWANQLLDSLTQQCIENDNKQVSKQQDSPSFVFSYLPSMVVV